MKEAIPPFLVDALACIEPISEKDREQAWKRLDNLTKPVGSLGRLESIAAQCAAIAAGDVHLPLRAAAYVFAADHGVAAAGVSAYPAEVTAQMVRNFLAGGAAINVLSTLHGVSLSVVDVGVNAIFDDHPGLIRSKVRRGSRNFLDLPAMSGDELRQALEVGLSLARKAAGEGHQIVAVGEMGIGNTTAASAMSAQLIDKSVDEVTGRGTGLDDAGRERKRQVIREALQRRFPDSDARPAPLEILRCVGGLEIAAMTGFILGAAGRRVAVVVDGFISTAAAAVACALSSRVKDYLFAGHCSQEPGHLLLLNHLHLRPVLQLEMRLGEGSGAVLAIPVIRSAVHLYCEMATFASAGVSTSSR